MMISKTNPSRHACVHLARSALSYIRVAHTLVATGAVRAALILRHLRKRSSLKEMVSQKAGWPAVALNLHYYYCLLCLTEIVGFCRCTAELFGRPDQPKRCTALRKGVVKAGESATGRQRTTRDALLHVRIRQFLWSGTECSRCGRIQQSVRL